jgi:hypothetical protein
MCRDIGSQIGAMKICAARGRGIPFGWVSMAFPPDDRGKLATDPTKERVAEDPGAEHSRRTAPLPRNFRALPALITPSRRLSYSANSSNVSAARHVTYNVTPKGGAWRCKIRCNALEVHD